MIASGLGLQFGSTTPVPLGLSLARLLRVNPPIILKTPPTKTLLAESAKARTSPSAPGFQMGSRRPLGPIRAILLLGVAPESLNAPPTITPPSDWRAMA